MTDSDPSNQLEPARFYYGWRIAAVCTVAMVATSPGQTVVVSQFNSAIRESLGISTTVLSTSYMIATLCAAVPLVLVGKASDRFGPRMVMGAVAILFACACALMGQVREVFSLTIGFFLIRSLGQGALSLASGHMLAMWFEKKLGTVNGLKLVGTQFGFAIVPGFALVLISTLGWRLAWPALGATMLVVLLPLVIVVARDHPGQVGQNLDGLPDKERNERGGDGVADDPAFTLHESVRTRAYWIIALAMTLNGLIGTAIIFHVQPLLEWRGLDPDTSVAVLRTWSLTVMCCVFPAGWLADRVKPRILIPVSLVLLGLSSIAVMAATESLHAHSAFALFGISMAIGAGVGPPTIARYFGRAHHGAIRGSISRIGVAGTGVGPVILGSSLDLTGGFAPGLVLFGVVSLVVMFAAATLVPPVRGQVE